jgi:hypothetical protein
MLSDTNTLQYSAKFKTTVDMVTYQAGYLVNTEEWLSTPFSCDRVAKEYTLALKGEFENGFEERVELAERVHQSVCYLTKMKDPKGSPLCFWSGSCYAAFHSSNYCCHAAVLQWKHQLLDRAMLVPTKKESDVRRKLKAKTRMEKAEIKEANIKESHNLPIQVIQNSDDDSSSMSCQCM